MSHVMDFEHENLVHELRELGATDTQAHELARDPRRARAAVAKALGTANPIATVLTLFRSKTFLQPARAENLSATPDPRYTDDGERVWQPGEVSDEWRRGYLDDCRRALSEGREPAARYAPSDEEFSQWFAVMAALGVPGDVSPASLEATGARALDAWAAVWGLAPDPRDDDLDLGPPADLFDDLAMPGTLPETVTKSAAEA